MKQGNINFSMYKIIALLEWTKMAKRNVSL